MNQMLLCRWLSSYHGWPYISLLSFDTASMCSLASLMIYVNGVNMLLVK